MTPRMSLIERKKLQWAKEREELASLGGPWVQLDPQNVERTVNDPKASMVSNEYFKRNLRENAARRGSLPPLCKNQYNSLDRYDKGGETSGYGSDNNNHTPEFAPGWNQSGYESSSSRDDRPRWGDKAKVWQNKEETANEPPNWVKRGLKAGEIEVNNTSPSVSPEQRFEEQERPCTSSSYSHQRATYIRGQNIPIDSVELAERERRRQLALAHQEAIRQQLEDRERKRREERERRIQEEHEEELRIEREQEVERRRKEEELRALREKQEKERKRNEAIQEAIELAQKEAQLEKTKRKNNVNITRDEQKDKTASCPEIENEPKHHSNLEPEQLNNTKNVPSTKQEVLTTEVNNLEIRGKGITSPRNPIETTTTTTTTQATSEEPNQQPLPNNQTPRTDNIAIVLPTTLEALPTIQYALLVPTTPFNIPQTARSTASTARTENRILTPTQYRLKNVLFCDSSTQTDESVFGTSRSENSSEGRDREKLTNLELTYDNRNRKERRSRSESLEERPKWGVNRPPTRYLKQSEKDPLYQRRKLRQKMRESKPFDDKNSSDDSQTVSPRPHRKRNTRALWRKSDQMYSRKVRMYHTELVPLESDRDRIYYSNVGGCCCSCMCGRHRCSDSNVKVDILKIDHNSPRETENEGKLQLPRVEGIDDDVLNKLSSLQNGLLAKQEQWDTSSLSANH